MRTDFLVGTAGSLDLSTLWLLDDQRLGRKEPNMMIGVDYHPSFQQIAFLMEETGEYSERRLNHSDGEAEQFYRDLQLRGVHVRVGMEATTVRRVFVSGLIVCSSPKQFRLHSKL